MAYTLDRTFTDAPFAAVVERVCAALGRHGFGVLTEIDVQATLQKKLGLETRPYRILGACNPPFAHRVLAAVPHVGVLLPCNVVVWDEGDHRVVAAMEPRVMGRILDHPEVKAVADEVSARLRKVLAAID